MRRKSQRAAKKELLKREEAKRNTLHEILKLKDEIAEVTTAFKVGYSNLERGPREKGTRSSRQEA